MKDGNNVSCTGCIKQFKKQNNMETEQLRLESLRMALNFKERDSIVYDPNARIGQFGKTGGKTYTVNTLLIDAEMIYQYLTKTK